MPSIEIDGKSHELFCGLVEHEAIWKITGKNLLVGENVADGVNPGNLARILHVMIRGAVPIEQITASLTRTTRVVTALKAVVDTINDGMGDAVAAQENPSRAA